MTHPPVPAPQRTRATCPRQGVCACAAEPPGGLAGVLALILDARARLLTQHATLATRRRAHHGGRSDLLPDVLDDALDNLSSAAWYLRCRLPSPASAEHLEAAA